MQRTAAYGGLSIIDVDALPLVWVVFYAPGTSGSIEVQALPDTPDGWERVREICEGCDIVKVITGKATSADNLRKRAYNAG